MKTPNIAGFVGYKGDNVWLEPSQQYEDDAALVQDCPDLFDDVPAQLKRGPGRPPKFVVTDKQPVDKAHAVD